MMGTIFTVILISLGVLFGLAIIQSFLTFLIQEGHARAYFISQNEHERYVVKGSLFGYSSLLDVLNKDYSSEKDAEDALTEHLYQKQKTQSRQKYKKVIRKKDLSPSLLMRETREQLEKIVRENEEADRKTREEKEERARKEASEAEAAAKSTKRERQRIATV